MSWATRTAGRTAESTHTMLTRMALKSLRNRGGSVALTVISIAVAVFLLLGVEKLRTETRESFLNTLSGTDLIVGPRSGSVQLLLYSVFRIGNPSNNLSWESYRQISRHPYVGWSIPLSLGDSHRGFRVLGTNEAYFQHLRYGPGDRLVAADGLLSLAQFEAVLGDSVARDLGYQIGETLIVAHGTGEGSFSEHDDLPFRIIGILEPTGTPVDRTVHVSLQGMEAIHLGWESGAHRSPGGGATEPAEPAPEPSEISAFLLGVKQPTQTLQIQRAINEYPREPLTAILPGIALQELWGLVGVAERALLAVSALVVLTGLIGMMTVILSGLNERRREMAILRSVGARPRHIFLLLMAESTLLGTFGAVSGVLLLNVAMLAGAPYLRAASGLHIAAGAPGSAELLVISAVMVTSMLLGLIPAWRAYQNSLADGLSIRL